MKKKRWYVQVDVSEQQLLEYDKEVFETLLKDRTTGKNILWGTDDYFLERGDEAYAHGSQILSELITAENDGTIKPRALKSRALKRSRVKAKAEVYTPAWICNAQNNLVDEAWFGYKNPFNAPNTSRKSPHEYTVAPLKRQDPKQKVKFPKGKTWKDYVRLNRLEVTCGEAPYLVNRYDSDSPTVTLRKNIKLRIGLLDRKLRVICENAHSEKQWWEYTRLAYRHVYGFEWLGDSLLIARENLLLTLFDYYQYRFGAGKMPDVKKVRQIAEIISWNIWQMDGLTQKVIYATDPKKKYAILPMFEEDNAEFCKIKDWDEKDEKGKYGKIIHFASLLNR